MEKLKVLAINGSPRGRNGNTDRILQPFLQGAQAAGAECETVYAKDLSIKECSGCFACWEKTPGVCIHQDDMPELLLKIRKADILVWATPLYHYNMTVYLKRIIERTLPLSQPYMIKSGSMFRHPLRYEIMPSKTLLISNCGFPDRGNFEALLKTFQGIGGQGLSGQILCAGGELLGAEELREELKWYTQAAYAAGREIIELGGVTEATSRMLEKPLVPAETYAAMANAHWRVAGDSPSLQAAWPDSDAPRQDPDIVALEETDTGSVPELQADSPSIAGLLKSMVGNFNPDEAKDMKGVYQFRITGNKHDEFYFLRIAEGKCTFHSGAAPDASLTIITPAEVWLKISSGELNGQKALLEGKYKFEGDLNLLIKMNSLFSAQKPETIPQKGPLKIRGLQWLTVAFIPWIYFWFFAGSSRLSALLVPLALSLVILVYRLKYIEPTFMDVGGVIFFSLAALLHFLCPNVLLQHSGAISSLAQAGIWSASLAADAPVTAAYSKYNYPAELAQEEFFLKINSMITAFWVLVFLLQAVISLLAPAEPMSRTIWTVAGYLLLIPGGIFTNRIPRIYLAKSGSRQRFMRQSI